jgi:hypothetical protein
MTYIQNCTFVFKKNPTSRCFIKMCI